MHDALPPSRALPRTPTPTPTRSTRTCHAGTVGLRRRSSFVALAVILLVWDMMRRIRRGRVRADISEELDAESRPPRVEATEVDDQSDGCRRRRRRDGTRA